MKPEFITLQWKPDKGTTKKETKKSKNPFSKGSWKHYLTKKLLKWKTSKHVDNFHFIKAENIFIYRKDKPKVILTKKVLNKDDLSKLQSKHKDCHVLINALDDVFIKISLKAYSKLIDIDKIAIEYRFKGVVDGDDEYDDLYEDTKIITNINDLMTFINYHRNCISGVFDIQAKCCAYDHYEWKFKMVVMKRDGSTETYKGDMNDFMRKYNLMLF